MKSGYFYLKVAILVVIVGSVVFSFCKRDQKKLSNVNLTVSYLQQAKWKIDSYTEKDKAITNDFSGYEFIFEGDGAVHASKSGRTSSGTWSYGRGDNRYKLNLDFGSGVPLEELNKDWIIIDATSMKIMLRHKNGENEAADDITLVAI